MAEFYFAYGSNMSLAQMRTRCPASPPRGVGLLRDHALVFPRFSERRQCGVAGIAARAGAEVWGVVYQLDPADLPHLDSCEGYAAGRPRHHNNYNRAAVTVELQHGDRQSLPCLTYAAVAQTGSFLPSLHYLETMVTGAVENGLPASYVGWLRRLPVTA